MMRALRSPRPTKVPFQFTGKIGKGGLELEDVKMADHYEEEHAGRVAALGKALAA